MSKIRKKIAEWLDPVAVKDAQKYRRLRYEIESDRWWLAYDFPEIKAFADRLLSNDQNYWRSIEDEYTPSRWRSEIDYFREQLRQGEARKT